MKRELTLIIIIFVLLFNIVACRTINDKSKTPLEKTEELANNVYEAVKNHNSELLKSQFCESLQTGKENSMDDIYEFLDGEIETVETDFETDHYASASGAGKVRGDKLSKSFVFKIVFITDKGTRYEIGGKGDIVNTIEPKNQGLQVIHIYKQMENGEWDYTNNYLTIGKELD